DHAAEAGELDPLVDLLAHDAVECEIRLPGARAIVVASGGELGHPAEREGDRLLAMLRCEAEFRPDPEIADLVAAPAVVHERILVDDAARFGELRVEERTQVSIDPGHGRERAEELDAV